MNTIGWSVNHFTYTGDIPLLERVTALGMYKDDGHFYVQVDDFNHPWSHGWHKITNVQDWKAR